MITNFFRTTLFLALIFSASNLQGQHDGYYMPSKQRATTVIDSSQTQLQVVVIEVNGNKIFGFIIVQELQSIWDIETPSTEWYEAEKLKVDADAAKNRLYEFGVLVASDTTLAGMYGGRIEHPVIMGDTATVIFWPKRPGFQIASLPHKKLSSDSWQIQVRLKDGGMLFLNSEGEVDAFDQKGDQLDKDNQDISVMLTEAAAMIPF